MDINESSIVIIADGTKESFVENFRKKHPLFDINVLELSEFKKKYFFDFTKETVYYVHKNYGVIKEIAEIYIENLYYINGDVHTPKIDFLISIKKDLEKNGLLIFDPLFKNYLKGKDVVLYNLHCLDSFYEQVFSKLQNIANVRIYTDDEQANTIKPLYKLRDRDAEVGFVASKIAELLKSGISIDNIKLANVNEDYIFSLRKVFKDFHIPIEIEDAETIESTVIFSKFKDFYSADMDNAIKELEPFIKSVRDEEVFKAILSTVNEYYWTEDYLEVKEFILSDLKKTKLRPTRFKHAVRTIDFLTDEISSDDYVFLINFNQGAFPKMQKDEDYLNDKTKRLLGLSDSIDINKKITRRVREVISTTANLFVTYAARDLKGELYISNAYDEQLFIYEDPEINLNHSDAYNRKILLARLDENKKYGTIDETLETLLAHYKDEPYLSFDNAFKGIDPDSLKSFLNGKLTLSYSSMDDYYRCSFRYYLNNVVKIDKFEDSFATVTGTIFHEVLSSCFDEDFDFEKAWNRAVEKESFEFGKMENFYLGLLKEELEFIISNLHKQTEFTSLDKSLYEKKIVVNLDEKGDVVFKGFVDKIMYGETEDGKVAAIVDYKTGQPELNLDNIIYGLDMQLPLYAYLLKHFEPLKDAKIGGFYLQKIINNEKDNVAKEKALKLQGYSNANPRILKRVDKTYEDSSLIKSMKMAKGNFYAYSKVLTDSQIDEMIKLVENNIKTAAENILAANFQIDPKEIRGENKGCKFCTFQDICFMKNENIKSLEEMKKEQFLGGEDNDGMD